MCVCVRADGSRACAMNIPEFETFSFPALHPLTPGAEPPRPDDAAAESPSPTSQPATLQAATAQLATAQPLVAQSASSSRRTVQLHRLREVRHEQGISIKRAAQLMGSTVEEIRAEEATSTDLTLSRLYEWQRMLEVPIEDLLVEPHAPLSEPVLKRARMLRLMKTVQAILERSHQSSVRRLAQTMINQLIEIMPELEGVTPWHQADRPRSRDQNSRILESSYRNEARPD